jgi:hypothetical protein
MIGMATTHSILSDARRLSPEARERALTRLKEFRQFVDAFNVPCDRGMLDYTIRCLEGDVKRKISRRMNGPVVMIDTSGQEESCTP